MKTTPMLHQYQSIKAQYRDCILMFRLGDFYEMFGEDARRASAILEITLTSRDFGNGNRLPLCGVPYHSSDHYIARLLKNGCKVAIAEQMEDPATCKGLVPRDVVRVITPGTNLDLVSLEPERNNFIVAFTSGDDVFGISLLDVSTGDFSTGEIEKDSSFSELIREIERIEPVECLSALAGKDVSFNEIFVNRFPNIKCNIISPVFDPLFHSDHLCRHFGVPSLLGYGIENFPYAITAASYLLEYVRENLKTDPTHIRSISLYNPHETMYLDAITRRNLELTATLRSGEKRATLLWVLDRTKTSMGKRLLRRWLERPLIEPAAVHRRLEGVRELLEKKDLRRDLAEKLLEISDLERLSSRVATKLITPKELLAVRDSMRALPAVKNSLKEMKSEMLVSLHDEIDELADVRKLLEDAISEDAPRMTREGGIIRDGYHEEVDKLREVKQGGRNWIAELEEEESRKTGIKSLKIGFNKVFGYYIEVTRPNLHLVPDRYIRKQTMSNCERFFTPELKEKELTILGAEEKCQDLEYELFVEIRDNISAEIHRILATARALAALDVLVSFAETAVEHNYTCPIVNDSDMINLVGARHPVLEKMLPPHSFIPNDTYLDCTKNQVHIITGPNMSGKSTYMRQVALVVLMAQVGSFVPCEKAEIGVADRIFTRVGAVDDITLGLSTFMVEMIETSVILHNATRRSLILLDEVGRGTGTSDGISIAWAVTEYIHERLGARTLFATHFLELTGMAELHQRIQNFYVSAYEKGKDIVFTHKVHKGSADRSFGVEVARLAGLPSSVVQRAADILNARPDGGQITPPKKKTQQLSLLPEIIPSPVEERLSGINPDELTPRKALELLYEMKMLMEKGKSDL
ncbi:MAG: DNA mismatch repair protein MutS [bacterium]